MALTTKGSEVRAVIGPAVRDRDHVIDVGCRRTADRAVGLLPQHARSTLVPVRSEAFLGDGTDPSPGTAAVSPTAAATVDGDAIVATARAEEDAGPLRSHRFFFRSILECLVQLFFTNSGESGYGN